MRFLIVLSLATAALASNPQILDWHVNVDSFAIASKRVTVDTLAPGFTDTVTAIQWTGSVVFSCQDSGGESMGVFIDVNIGPDTIQADSVWGAATAAPGNNRTAYFSFRTSLRNWTGQTAAKVRLSLDNVYLSYQGRPRIQTQPENVSTVAGSSAHFSVAATGVPAPAYLWLFNGSPLAGADKSIVTFDTVDSTKTGTYSVVVSNPIGSIISQTATLVVNFTPIIRQQPAAETVTVGQRALFSVSASSYPAATYQWKKNGTNVAGATGQSYSIASVTTADSGAYSVVLSNIIGNTASNVAALTINFKPEFLAQPKPQAVREGHSVILQVRAAARPAAVFQWWKNGIVLPGAVLGSYAVASFAAGDAGRYVASAANTAGSAASDTVELTLDNTPFRTDSMIAIAGGTFAMGKLGLSDPVHTVTLGSFRISNTQVTQAEYKRVMGINPSVFTGDSLMPVENVTWFDAVLYCNRRSKLESRDTVYLFDSIAGTPGSGATDLHGLSANIARNGYRLPTEAEYEYACRAGTATDYYWGGSYPPATSEDTMAIDCNAVWFHNSGGRTQKAGLKMPNPWGLYDIVGQAWHWLNDWYGAYADSSQIDPLGPLSGFSRVVRGGSWSSEDDDRHLRSMARNGGYFPNDRSSIIGFRIVNK